MRHRARLPILCVTPRALALMALIVLVFSAPLNADSLAPITSQRWEEYVEAATVHMAYRLGPGKAFLWVDEEPGRLIQLRAGDVIVSPVGPRNPKRVPSGLIHDWIGAAFIPHATLKDALQVVRDYGRYQELYQPNVTDSKALEIGESIDRFTMRLLNKSFFAKTALDTDYESCFVRLDDRHLYSTSRTTRIQQIEEYGTPAQHFLREGEGTGLIWRLFSITRYVERDGGVYLEIEVIGLSRDIPASLRWLIEPIVHRFSRAALSTSLRQTVNAIRLHSEAASRAPGHGDAIMPSSRAEPLNNLHAIQSSR
jgi:hypothetical protein